MTQSIVNCPHCGKIISADELAGKEQPKVKCPECGSQRSFKDGKRRTSTGQIQRYLCRDCGHRFS